ncbi:hypothetical protein M9H77_34762 [Catharanthus roseus]|uniref:Uncharacterized protein n=1 Tax=Catharanthus roseus TaxID=4058 RepID=A0ACB9ZM30_CATRO|nr:hypothetical protein M9H77_34762 [Catharanthus roseus]
MAVLNRLMLRWKPSASVFGSSSGSIRGFCLNSSSDADLNLPSAVSSLSAAVNASPVVNSNSPKGRHVQWVFLGCPGVGKGTYAARLSTLLGVPHISTGDLVRHELASHGPLSSKENFLISILYAMTLAEGDQLPAFDNGYVLCELLVAELKLFMSVTNLRDLQHEKLLLSFPLKEQLAEIVNQGKLISDEAIIDLLSKRLEAGEARGESGFILDGFPRTIRQASSKHWRSVSWGNGPEIWTFISPIAVPKSKLRRLKLCKWNSVSPPPSHTQNTENNSLPCLYFWFMCSVMFCYIPWNSIFFGFYLNNSQT